MSFSSDVKVELAKAINLAGGSAKGILDVNKEVKYQDGTVIEIKDRMVFAERVHNKW